MALALLMEPDVATMLSSIVFIGGAAFCPGNMTAFAEFNFLVDPHAAEIGLRSGAKLVMFGPDVTQKARVEDRHLESLQKNGNSCSGMAAR